MTAEYNAQDENEHEPKSEGLEGLLESMKGIQRGIDQIGSQVRENYGVLKEILEAMEHRESGWHEMYDLDEGYY